MPRTDDYKAAIALAVAELKNLNPKRLENRTGAQHFVEAAREGLIVPYFGQARRITWPEVAVTPGNGAGEISLPEQILILHYLLNASGDPLTGKTIGPGLFEVIYYLGRERTKQRLLNRVERSQA